MRIKLMNKLVFLCLHQLWPSPECSTPECSQWSTTTSQPSNGQAKSLTRPHQTTTSEDQLTSSDSYITYTDIYAPGIIDSSSSDCEEGEKLPENHSDGLTAADVVSNLSLKLHSRSCSRFNINRANVWDGALRGFKQSTYDPTYTMLVRFSDDVGQIEEALDTGGPTREFLTLLIDTMKTRRIFEGKDNAKYLSFDSKALEDDEYFHVGRMIAVSMVHGGPGPRCLSPNFFLYLVGKVKAIEATIEDIHDDEVRKALLEINNTTSLTELQRLADKHSSMLQTAGCYRFMTSLDDKKRVKDDYIQWYFTYRNHLSIQRFKEGLATLDFLNALEQHPALFMPFMCYSENCVMLWRACFMCSSVHLVAPCVRRRPEH
ncbi:G2/M phase-specific E3 ubiquitin-protein ligase-like [Centropristis striata]|uniref:G2/M phase-specific E3 ubiquitin-protein ligase-like n=1 Tax=Centropristis striata TaxID=184440 RepID=UPI0027DEE05E|nr:G2/M phase-specific E3 ubiquitin-protein ligase-like [Centropristis striata]